MSNLSESWVFIKKEEYMKLDTYRKKIDTLDKKLLTILHKRFDFVYKIKKLKENTGLSVEDKKREMEVLHNIIAEGKDLRISRKFLIQLFNLIIEESKSIQRK